MPVWDPRREQYRRNAAGQAAAGGAMVGAGSAWDYALNERLKRKNAHGVLRSAASGKLSARTHVPHVAGKLGVRSLQVAGLPLAAVGVKNVIKPRPNRPVDLADDVVAPVVRRATFADQVATGEERFNKAEGPRRVLVTGARDWDDEKAVHRHLDRLHKRYGSLVVIEGGARGADAHARSWAAARGVPNESFPANWRKYGRAAGPIRNKQMLEQGKPHEVVAFHRDLASSKGTRSMVGLARRAGVRTTVLPRQREPHERFNKTLTLAETRRLDAHKRTGRLLSLGSGTMGVAALGLRGRDRQAAGGAVAGSGAALMGVGVVGGGAPGFRSNSRTIANVRHGRGFARMAAAASSGRGGIFGYRRDAHEGALRRFEAGRDANAGKPTTVRNMFMRGREVGKIPPEQVIIAHMRRGRKLSHGALGAGAALGATGLVMAHRRVDKAQRRGEEVAGAVAGGGATLAGLGTGGRLFLNAQSRRWATRAQTSLERAQHASSNVAVDRTGDQIYARRAEWKGKTRGQAYEAGVHRGDATQAKYFSRVYRKMGTRVGQAGVAGALVGAAGGGALLAYRRQVGKALTADEQRRLNRHRTTGRTLSLASGTMGLGALGLRAPQAAASLTRRGVPRLGRLAARSEEATRHSNTLGIAAIGTGSAGSFNYAAQQKLERRREVAKDKSSGKKAGAARAREIAIARDAERKASEAVAGAAQRAKAPKPVQAPRERPVLPVQNTWANRVARLRLPNRAVSTVLVGVPAAAGAYWAGQQVRKADRRDAAVAAGAVGGAGALYGPYVGAGYAASHAVEGRQRAVLTPAERRLVYAHRRSLGMSNARHAMFDAPHSTRARFYESYPERVRYSGAKRLLARTHGPHGYGRLAVPVSLVGAGVGGGATAGVVGKAAYFNRPAPLETSSGSQQRLRTEASHQGWRAASAATAAGSTAAIGSRWAGSEHAPEAITAGRAYARAKGVPKETVNYYGRAANRLHAFAKPRRGRLLAASAGLGAASAGANAVARWRRDEVTGISQDMGRAAAGRTYQHTADRVSKDAMTALGLEAAVRGGKVVSRMSRPQRRKAAIAAGSLATGVLGTAGGVRGVQLSRRHQVERAQLVGKGAFLERYHDRISPDAESGWRYLRRNRNEARAATVGQAALTGVGGWLTGHEVNGMRAARAAGTRVSPVGTVAAGAGTLAAAYSALNSGRKAHGLNAKMGKIEAKARQREHAGLYAPGRGRTPVDTTSARARNLASARVRSA